MSRKRILIVDDELSILVPIKFLLEKNGYQVIQAGDGITGIEKAGESRPDMILLDIQLPEMDGYTVARKLKSNPQFSDTPIVAVTSYAMVGDRERVLESGCTGYIEKPINPETFVEEISQYLSIE